MSTHRRVPLATLVERWGRVVADVERGYTLTLDDYLNDLDLRHRIAKRLPDVADDDAALVHLHAVDDRFRAATEPVAECMWGDVNAREEGWTNEREWYYFRQPRQLPDEW